MRWREFPSFGIRKGAGLHDQLEEAGGVTIPVTNPTRRLRARAGRQPRRARSAVGAEAALLFGGSVEGREPAHEHVSMRQRRSAVHRYPATRDGEARRSHACPVTPPTAPPRPPT